MKVLHAGMLLEGKLCVIVGAGKVAARKAQSLIDAGARLRVVAEHFNTDFDDLDSIERVSASYEKRHIEGARLVVAATSCSQTNSRVARDARSIGAIVNVVDTPRECDFIFPAVSQKGDISVAVSTGGASPLLARKLKEQIDSSIEDIYAELAAVLKKVRQRAINEIPNAKKRRAFFEELASDEFMDLIRREGPERAAVEAEKRLEAEVLKGRAE